MGNYQLQRLGPRAYAKHESLLAIASLDAKAQPDTRQTTIDFLAREHAMDLTTTKSLRYDPSLLSHDGKNHNGDVRISPRAFQQDIGWLANVIFHEIVHSDQFAFYSRYGMDFSQYTKADEPVRVMIALDEYEGFYWSWRNSDAFGLEPAQKASLGREVQLWQIEIDDEPTLNFARAGRFNDARLALLKRLGKKVP